MKISSTFHVSALLMVVLTFSMPLVPLAQQNLHAEAIIAAQRDAQNDVNKSLWFLGGCLGGVIGVIIAYGVEPAPSATRLLGKSPEYVAFYTDAYKEKAKRLQADNAMVGCGVNALVTVVYIMAVLAEAYDN